MKISFFFLLVLVSFSQQGLSDEAPPLMGPAGPVVPTVAPDDTVGTSTAPAKPTLDLPYKPATTKTEPTPLTSPDLGETPTTSSAPVTSVIQVPTIPSLSPDPVGAPDPQW